MARAVTTYRGARRNAWFGRKPVGNTKPGERQKWNPMVTFARLKVAWPHVVRIMS